MLYHLARCWPNCPEINKTFFNFQMKRAESDQSSCLSDAKVRWLRPRDLCSNPRLRGKDEPSLPLQGPLGDCWLICAFYVLAKCDQAWHKVFNHAEEDLHGDSNSGEIVINLWNMGIWKKIKIDDTLPVQYNNSSAKWELMYSRCKDPTQCWAPLLEKALAKFYGSYELLHSGQLSEGYHLVTGSYSWKQDLCPDISSLSLQALSAKIKLLLSESESFVFITSSTSLADRALNVNDSVVALNAANLDRELHCYTITGMRRDTDTNEVYFSVWNPWEKCKTKVDIVSLKRLCEQQSRLDFTSLRLENIFSQAPQSCNSNVYWSERIVDGEWKAVSSSGGNREYKCYFQNPQFLLTFKTNAQSYKILHLTLIQSSHRKYHRRKELEQAIGLHVFELPSQPKSCLTLDQFNSILCVCSTSPEYQYSQNVTLLSYLAANAKLMNEQYYLIVPSTYCPNINSNFVLRVCSNTPIEMVALK